MNLSDLVFIDSTGYHYADYPTFLAWLTTQYQGIYGADVYLEADSMDGQFLAILANAFFQTAQLGASVYNSFSPLTGQGVGLSRTVKINGLTRLSPSFSTVVLTIVGTSGTTINNGIATDQINQQWLLPTTVVIPDSGTIDVTATAQLIGFVTANASSITNIFTPTRGWQTVTNAGAASPGAPVETDAELRIRQSLSTSVPAQTVFDATLGSVANVTGVTKVTGYENYTDTTDANGLPAHSICVVTVGGASQDIANAIGAQKTPGTNPTGNAGPFVVLDARGMPLNIKYSVALPAEIQVTVNGIASPAWSTNSIPLIQAAIAAYLNAIPIGSIIFFSGLYIPAYLIGTPQQGTYSITSIVIGKNGGSQSASDITLATGMNAEDPLCNPSVDVTVNIS